MVERRRPPNAQLLEIGGMLVICAVAVVGALLTADAQAPNLG
jgi:hypothetical protein